MRYKDLRNADLNLLVAFNALMEERSITGAARRLFLSQPAMSRTVDRLQVMFKDQLLVRAPNGYEPTHRASVIYAAVQKLLPQLEALFSESEFNPATVTDLFRIESSDLGATVVIPGLIKAIAERAPGVQIHVLPRTGDFERLEKNEVDLVLTPSTELEPSANTQTHLQSEALFREKLVCLVRTGHALAKRRLTVQDFFGAQHVSLSPMQGTRRSSSTFVTERHGVMARALERLGRKADVRVRIPYFVPLGPIVETTDLVATVPLQIARRLQTPRLRIVSAPIEFEGFTYNQVWHSRNDSTPIHKWIRGVIRNLTHGLT